MKFSDLFNNDYTPKWDYIETIPEFAAMKTCKHSEYWHMEGSPWNHTKLVVNNAIALIHRGCCGNIIFKYKGSTKHEKALLLAALFHDIAKPIVTDYDESKRDWAAPNHANNGAVMTRMLLFDEDINLREEVVFIVKNHMMMHHILDDPKKIEKKLFRFAQNETINPWNDVVNGIVDYTASFDMLCYMCICDDFGSVCQDEAFVEKLYKQNHIYSLREGRTEHGFSIKDSAFFAEVYGNQNCLIARNVLFGEPLDDMSKDVKVYVLIGTPGSGKTTYYKNHFIHLPIVSRDIARSDLGFCKPGEKYIGTKDEEDKVTKYINDLCIKYATAHQDFVVDNTHMKTKYRDALHILLKDYRVEWNYVYVEAPTLEENIRRRQKDGFGDKAEGIIKNMFMGLEFPETYEYDTLTVYKQTLD